MRSMLHLHIHPRCDESSDILEDSAEVEDVLHSWHLPDWYQEITEHVRCIFYSLDVWFACSCSCCSTSWLTAVFFLLQQQLLMFYSWEDYRSATYLSHCRMWLYIQCGCLTVMECTFKMAVRLYRLLLINWLWVAKCLNVRICCWSLSFQALNQESLGFWLLAIYRLHFRLWEAGINIFHIC